MSAEGDLIVRPPPSGRYTEVTWLWVAERCSSPGSLLSGAWVVGAKQPVGTSLPFSLENLCLPPRRAGFVIGLGKSRYVLRSPLSVLKGAYKQYDGGGRERRHEVVWLRVECSTG